jgi:pantetheine-phosphate adenylyltransferase
MLPGETYSYLSARLVREIAQLGGPLQGLVPPVVEKRIRTKFDRGSDERQQSAG